MYLSDEIQSLWPCWWQLTFVKPTAQPVTVPSKHFLPHSSPHRCFLRKNLVFFPFQNEESEPQMCWVTSLRLAELIKDRTRVWSQLSLVPKPKLIPQCLVSHRTEVISVAGSHLHPSDVGVLAQHWLLSCFPASVAPLSSLPWRIVGSRQGSLPTRVAV